MRITVFQYIDARVCFAIQNKRYAPHSLYISWKGRFVTQALRRVDLVG